MSRSELLPGQTCCSHFSVQRIDLPFSRLTPVTCKGLVATLVLVDQGDAEERCAAAVPSEHRVAPDHATRCVRVADGSLWSSAAP